MIKVTKETRGSSGIPLPAPFKLKEHSKQFPTGYQYPTCRLLNVYFDPKKEMKSSKGGTQEKPILGFLFKDAKERQFTHLEFPIDEDAKTPEVKQDAMVSRIKHIWDETIGADKFAKMEGETYHDFFKNVAEAFNSQVITKEAEEEGKKAKVTKVYSTADQYIKLVYYKTDLKLPMYPNFLQRAVINDKRVPCEGLIINPKYDQIEPSQQAKSSSLGALDNDFGGEGVEMDDDFPVV